MSKDFSFEVVYVKQKYALSKGNIPRKFWMLCKKYSRQRMELDMPMEFDSISICREAENFPTELGGEGKFLTLKVFLKIKMSTPKCIDTNTTVLSLSF